MTEEIRLVIAGLCGLAVFILSFSKKLFKDRSYKRRFINKAKERKSFVTAHLSSAKFLSGLHESDNIELERRRKKCCYEYVVHGKTYKKNLVFFSGGRISINYPYEIVVYYDPKRPSKCYCEEEMERSTGCLGSSIAALIVFLLVNKLLSMI